MARCGTASATLRCDLGNVFDGSNEALADVLVYALENVPGSQNTYWGEYGEHIRLTFHYPENMQLSTMIANGIVARFLSYAQSAASVVAAEEAEKALAEWDEVALAEDGSAVGVQARGHGYVLVHEASLVDLVQGRGLPIHISTLEEATTVLGNLAPKYEVCFIGAHKGVYTPGRSLISPGPR